MILAPEDYYEDRPVEHSAQGDIHDDLPFVMAQLTSAFAPAGGRKRPSTGEEIALVPTLSAPGIVCSYTCGFTAQPPGTRGYAHNHRSVAPILSLRALKVLGMNNNELRKIRDGAHIQGFIYLPQTDQLQLEGLNEDEDEWTGHAAALTYRPTSVSQELLDARPRLARLTEAAQRILIVNLIAVFSPNDFDPGDADLVPPDMTDGWAGP